MMERPIAFFGDFDATKHEDVIICLSDKVMTDKSRSVSYRSYMTDIDRTALLRFFRAESILDPSEGTSPLIFL